MKILALSSEFPPYCGGIGTYAFEMGQAAHQLGAAVTVVAPDYGNERLSVDQNGGFPVLRYRGGPHSFRDLPSKLMTMVRFPSPAPPSSLVRARTYSDGAGPRARHLGLTGV